MTAKAVGEIMGTVPVKTKLYFDNFYIGNLRSLSF